MGVPRGRRCPKPCSSSTSALRLKLIILVRLQVERDGSQKWFGPPCHLHKGKDGALIASRHNPAPPLWPLRPTICFLNGQPQHHHFGPREGEHCVRWKHRTFRQRDRFGWPRGLKCKKVDNGTCQKIVFVFPVGLLASGRLLIQIAPLAICPSEVVFLHGPGAGAAGFIEEFVGSRKWRHCTFPRSTRSPLNAVAKKFSPVELECGTTPAGAI